MQQLARSQPLDAARHRQRWCPSTDRCSCRLAMATGAHSRSRGHSVAVHGGRRSRALLRSMGSCGATLGVDCLPRSVSGTGSLRRGPSFQLLQAVPPFGQAGHIQQEAARCAGRNVLQPVLPPVLGASEEGGNAACAATHKGACGAATVGEQAGLHGCSGTATQRVTDTCMVRILDLLWHGGDAASRSSTSLKDSGTRQ
jgi:hypothetical protein